jgi:hypothetical protein
MRINLLILVFLAATALQLKAVDLPRVINNTVNSEYIRTVEMYRAGWKLSNPIIEINSDEQLVFSFDDLNPEKSDYHYTVYHCNRDWEISSISQQEYLDSFTDFPISDFAYSQNTNVHYINYMLSLPNQDLPLVLPGNYALVVFNRNQPDKPVITWRFYVVDPKVKISARIRPTVHDGPRGENQEINFAIEHGNYPIEDANSDIKVVITQNNRSDNAIENLKPVYINNGILEYEHNTGNTFKGENEFRAFEIRNIKYTGEGVGSIRFSAPLYHATLLRHIPRAQRQYNFYEEMNGNFFIEAFNKREPEIEADYIMVHFTLEITQPLLGGGVYVFGKLSNWQCKGFNKMTYSLEKRRYEHSMLLKQGYYNFNYVYKDDFTGEIKGYNLEGSHSQTENDYYIYVYHGRLTDRYDRLIGYQRFNSNRNRNY